MFKKLNLHNKNHNNQFTLGAGREEFTLQLLENFKKKLHSLKEHDTEDGSYEPKSKGDDVDKDEDW